MNMGNRITLTAAGNSQFLLKDETRRIIGCAFELLSEIGHGLYKKIYENALAVEFKRVVP